MYKIKIIFILILIFGTSFLILFINTQKVPAIPPANLVSSTGASILSNKVLGVGNGYTSGQLLPPADSLVKNKEIIQKKYDKYLQETELGKKIIPLPSDELRIIGKVPNDIFFTQNEAHSTGTKIIPPANLIK